MTKPTYLAKSFHQKLSLTIGKLGPSACLLNNTKLEKLEFNKHKDSNQDS